MTQKRKFGGQPREYEHHEGKYLFFPDDPWKRRWDVISALYFLV